MSLIDSNRSWYKKHNPSDFENMVLPKDHKIYFKRYFDSGIILDDVLLYSTTPGCGKSTIAKLLGYGLNYDVWYIDGSVKNGIDTIRNEVIPFVGKGKKKSTLGKVIIIEECDRLSPEAQEALRVTMDIKKNTMFILTCNYKSKLTPPLLSRFQQFNFEFNTEAVKSEIKPEIKERLKKIYELEEVRYSDEFIDELIKREYPSIRNMIKLSQKIYEIKGELTDKKHVTLITEELVKSIKDFNVKAIFKALNEADIDYSNVYRFVYDLLIPTLVKGKKIEAILLTNEYQIKHGQVVDIEINMVSYFIKLSQLIK